MDGERNGLRWRVTGLRYDKRYGRGSFLDGWWWLLTSQLGCSKEDWQLRKLHQCLLLGWAPERHRKGDSHLCRFWHWLVQKLVAGYSFLVHVPQSSSVLFFLRHRELPQLLAWLQDRLLPDELLQNRCCMQATKPYKSPKTNQMYEACPRRVPTLILQDSEDQMKSDGRWREVEAQGTIDRSWWPSRSYHCLLRWAAGGDISADINSIITGSLCSLICSLRMMILKRYVTCYESGPFASFRWLLLTSAFLYVSAGHCLHTLSL